MKVTILPKEEIFLGHVGEQNAIQLVFDITQWWKDSTIGPNGTVDLFLRQGGISFKVPAAQLSVEDGVVTWTVGSIATTQSGRGKCELIYRIDDVIAKSMVWPTLVLDPIDLTEDDPPQLVVQSLPEVYSAIEEAAETIGKAVLFTESQSLTEEQKATARNNIGVSSTISPIVDFVGKDLLDLTTTSFGQDICRAMYEAFEATGSVIPLNLWYDGNCVRQIILMDKLSNAYGNIYQFSILVYRPVEGDTYYLNEAERYFQLYKGYGDNYILELVINEP